MTEREKISHLHRRLGFGISGHELEAGEKRGLAATIDHLIDYERVDEQFTVSPWAFCWDEGQTDVYLDSFRPAFHWSLRMAMSERPLQEKLTLFWHDHFAVSGEKVETGPMMLSYLDTLRRHASGNFGEMLLDVSREPAMCFWLDTIANQKGRPNENFAREVLELFTLGLGNYKERDIQEAARAFTGWGIRYLLIEGGFENFQETAKSCIKTDRPMFAYAFSPDLHDGSPKTIFGETKNWTGEELLGHLASHPKTSRLIAGKLWAFFGSATPSVPAIDGIAATFTKTNGSIRSTIRTLVSRPEFWDDAHVRTMIKSPLDFVVPILRQTGLSQFLRPAMGKLAEREKPPAKPLRDIAGAVFFLSSQQGLQPLFPPDVDGWNWGADWITSANMTHRTNMPRLLLGIDSDQGGAGLILAQVLRGGIPATALETVERILQIFDAQLPPAKQALLVEACEKAGGVKSLTDGKAAAPMLLAVMTPLFASPEFQYF